MVTTGLLALRHAGGDPDRRHRPVGRLGGRVRRHHHRRPRRPGCRCRSRWLVGIASGVLFGLINGALVARFELAPFVVTLAALTTIRGLAFVYSEVPIAPEDRVVPLRSARRCSARSRSTTVIMLAVFLAGGVFLTRTPAGPVDRRDRRQRRDRAAGGHQRAQARAPRLHDQRLLRRPGRRDPGQPGRHRPAQRRRRVRARRDRRLRDRRRQPGRRHAAPPWPPSAACSCSCSSTTCSTSTTCRASGSRSSRD